MGRLVLKFQDHSIYHAGDTGYSDDFKETRIKLGAPKYAFIPIGAYDPEWFMEESHEKSEDVVRIMIDLEAERSFGMHWATFQLTDEDTIEPKSGLNMQQKMDIEGFIAPTPGEILRLQYLKSFTKKNYLMYNYLLHKWGHSPAGRAQRWQR